VIIAVEVRRGHHAFDSIQSAGTGNQQAAEHGLFGFDGVRGLDGQCRNSDVG